jgi:glycosyltransferase involved in cell wall biosynthesis
VANAIAGKGLPDAITAFGRTDIPGAVLTIVGDERKDREEAGRIDGALPRAADRVRFQGVVSADVLSQLYAGARLFLTASRYEGWPIAISEAMASGLPVVGFDTPGINDLVRSGRDGILVPVGDVDALSRGLVDVFRDRDLASALGEAGRRRALAWPTWEETGNRFAAALEGLVR